MPATEHCTIGQDADPTNRWTRRQDAADGDSTIGQDADCA